MSLERDLMDLEESLMRNDDCVHQSDYYTIVGLANDAREIEQERDTLKEENEKLRQLVRDMWHDGMCDCDEYGACSRCGCECEYGYLERMRDLGVEVNE